MRFFPLLLIVSFAFIQTPVLADPIASASTEFSFQLTSVGRNTVAALSALDIEMVLDTEKMKTQTGGENQDFTRIDTVPSWRGGSARTRLADGTFEYFFDAGSAVLFGEVVSADFRAGADDQTVGGDSAISTASGDIILSITADAGQGIVDLALVYLVSADALSLDVSGVGAMGSASASASASFRRLGGERIADDLLEEIDISRDEDGSSSDGTISVTHLFTVDPGETVRFRFDGAANATATATAVPEPSSFLLLGMLGLIGAWRQRYSKSKAS